MHAWLFFYHLNHKAGLHQDRAGRGAGPKHLWISAVLLNTPRSFVFTEEEEEDEKYTTTHYYPHIGVQQQSN